MKARYYISFDAVAWFEFFPSNTPKISLTKESDEIFKRNKVDAFTITKTKNKAIFDLIYLKFTSTTALPIETKYHIDINGVNRYAFTKSIFAGKLNAETSVYEVTPDPDDLYNPILMLYQKKWDNIGGVLLFGLAETYYHLQKEVTNFANYSFDTLSSSGGTISFVHSGTPATPQYASIDIPNPADGSAVNIIIKNFTASGAGSARIRLADVPGGTSYSSLIYFADGQITLIMSGTPATVILEFAYFNLTGVSISGSFDYEVYNPVPSLSGASLHDVISRIINYPDYFNLSYTILSTILWNDALGTDPPPNIDAYIITNPTNDYVIESANNWNNIWLTRADSVTTAKLENLEISLKDIMDILKYKLRMFWFIDEDGNFRIEHEKYFRDYAPQVDVTTITFAPDKPEVDKQAYSYDMGDAYSQVNYSENNEGNEDWTKFAKIEYNAILTSDNKKDIGISLLSTDVGFMTANPTTATNSGLLLLALDSSGCVLFAPSTITAGNYYPNLYLSWAWLTVNYMNYFSEAKIGVTVANVDIWGTPIGAHTFIHVKEFLKQIGVKFHYAAELDWKKPLALLAGTGWIESLEYIPETDMCDVNVAFSSIIHIDASCVIAITTGVTDDFVIILTGIGLIVIEWGDSANDIYSLFSTPLTITHTYTDGIATHDIVILSGENILTMNMTSQEVIDFNICNALLNYITEIIFTDNPVLTCPGPDAIWPDNVMIDYNGTPICICEITIGTQIWMCRDWFVNYPGSKVYDDDEANRVIYGGLYTYDQAMMANFVPIGWHVPTLDDWMILINYVGGLSVASGILKEIGTTHWSTPNTDAVDTYSFGARPAGIYGTPGAVYFDLTYATWLLTADKNGADLYVVHLNYSTAEVTIIDDALISDYFPVRLIKDISAVHQDYGALYNWYAISHQHIAGETVKYGYLYNWYVVSDARNIAPAGWHVPSRTEFLDLTTYLGGEPTAGGRLKEIGLVYFNTPNIGAVNDVGFNARGAGVRNETGTFTNLKIVNQWWSITHNSGDYYFAPDVSYDSASFPQLSYLKFNGFSVRFIKDDSTDTGTMTGNDGQIYNTVKIGSQVWMAQNSAETKYRNGDLITVVTDNTAWAALVTEGYCAYDNDENNVFN